MAGRFSYSSPGGGINRPWFRIGEIAVGSAAFLAVLSAFSMVVYAIDSSLLYELALIPADVRSLQVWRLVTWPLANGFTESLLWVAIDIALLWYFGNQLESTIGRERMATLLVTVMIIPGLIGTVLDLPQAGVSSVEFVVLLLFIAEYPNIRFFFGIPGWMLGAVFVVIQILQLLGDRHERELLFFLCTLLVGAFAGRAVGMLTQYDFIPRFPLPAGLNGTPKRKTSRQAGNAPRRNHRGQVLSGPWSAPPPPGQPAGNGAAAQAELDALLDKIQESGLASLTQAEKQRLNELSKRLR